MASFCCAQQKASFLPSLATNLAHIASLKAAAKVHNKK
jgi:hypothetical protein